MPFVRVTCDKHGVETTALLYTTRGHGKGKARLLYWFRTPPDIRVGRAAIDDAAISQIEQAHPEIQFDWPQILHASKSLAAAGARRARDGRPGLRGRRTQAEPEQAVAPPSGRGRGRGAGQGARVATGHRAPPPLAPRPEPPAAAGRGGGSLRRRSVGWRPPNSAGPSSKAPTAAVARVRGLGPPRSDALQ